MGIVYSVLRNQWEPNSWWWKISWDYSWWSQVESGSKTVSAVDKEQTNFLLGTSRILIVTSFVLPERRSYSELTELLSSILTALMGSRGRNNTFYNIQTFHFIYIILLVYSFFPVPCVHRGIGVYLCPEFFPNYRAQGTYKLSILLVK